MLLIDETSNHRDAEISIGDTLRFELSENPTTGYRWRMPDLGPALPILDDSYEAPTGGAGGGGERRWTLAADKPASSRCGSSSSAAGSPNLRRHHRCEAR